MEVNFTPDLQTKLSRLAAQRDCMLETLVKEAVDRLIDYEDWFLKEVDQGIAATHRGEFIAHSEIRKLLP